MKITPIGLALAITLTACGTTAEPAAQAAEGCPVTIPPSPGFRAPDPWPAKPVNEEWVWYGDEALWTVLSPDGKHPLTKGVWWSVNFPGGMKEEQPDLSVSWTRIGEGEPDVLKSTDRGTNAYTVEDGWFMISGVDPEPGCWEVTATYKGAVLSYVFEHAGT